MNSYNLAPDPETLAALSLLEAGVVSAAASRAFPHFQLCSMLYLQCTDGRWVQIGACGEDLEFKFEVFTLHVRPAERMHATQEHSLALFGPVSITPLITESWLDPEIPAGPTLGSDPVVQCIGAPGSVPGSASALCRYLGGVELIGSDGTTIVVATAGFPYDLHVTGISEDSGFMRSDYIALGHEA